LPTEPDRGERCRYEFLERVGDARSNNEVVGLAALKHSPHRIDVVGSPAPIAADREVAEGKPLSAARADPGPNARPTDPPTRLVGLDRLPARSADRITGFYSTGLRLPPLELSLNQSRDNVRHCRGRLPTKDALGLGGISSADLNVGSSK